MLGLRRRGEGRTSRGWLKLVTWSDAMLYKYLIGNELICLRMLNHRYGSLYFNSCKTIVFAKIR